MSWSYDPEMASDSDRVRFLVQDTDADDQLVQDEEIEFALAENPNIYRAAAMIARAIGLYFTKQFSRADKTSQLWVDAQEQAKKYLELAIGLEGKAVSSSSGGAGVFAGGVSVADVDARKIDTTRVQPIFSTSTHQ